MNIKLRTRISLAATQYKAGQLKFSQVSTDKGELYWDEAGEAAVGQEVYMLDEDAVPVLPADGDYETETRILTVEAGVITEIQEKESTSSEVEKVIEQEETPMEEPVNEYVSRAEYDALVAEVASLVAIIREIAGDVNSVDENFKKLDSKFSEAIKTSVSVPAQERLEQEESKPETYKDKQISKLNEKFK